MKEKDINLLLQKADELRALFILGQKVIPFLEEIFVFVRDIQPLLEEINHSVAENIKKMPGASEQLSKVTQANELATVEIMDVVDGILFKADLLEGNANRIKNNQNEVISNTIKLFDIIRRGINNGSDLKPALPVINNTLKSLENLNTEKFDEYQSETLKVINEIRNDSNSIIMSLQIQDITAQQIAAVNHILGTLQEKLLKILNHFQNTNITDLVGSNEPNQITTNVSTLHREIAFDPNAIDSLNKNLNRQQSVDDLISNFDSNDHINNIENNAEGILSSEEINSLSNKDNNTNDNTLNEAKTSTESNIADDINEDLDMEALMNSFNVDSISDGNSKTENKSEESDEDNLNNKLESLENFDGDFSQDDIDALFNS